jgi:hypothetical protein
MVALTDVELVMLQFEDRWWKRTGAKDRAIRRRFGLTPAAYYERLDALIDRPEAEAVAGLVVHRLRAQRADRAWPPGYQNRAV